VAGWLLDTNVLSETSRPTPDQGVLDFIGSVEPVFISAVSVHELRFGIERLPPGQRQKKLREWLSKIERLHADGIVGVGIEEAEAAAQLRAQASRQGRTLHLADGLIAGTAVRHGLVLVTRNVSDFVGLPMRVLDPWTS
jgi:predicted nucleic acid-binding protein